MSTGLSKQAGRLRALRFILAGSGLWLLAQAPAAQAQDGQPQAAPAAVPAPGRALPPPPPPPPPPRYYQAPHDGFYIRPVVDLGYELGGDRLLEVLCQSTNTTTGDVDYSTPSLRSGEGLVAGAGAHMRLNRASPFDLRLTVDYKYASVCNSASLDRVRFTALPTYRFGRKEWSFWAGAGPIYETGIKFHGDNLEFQASNGNTYILPDLDFKDALGGTIQLGWWFVALDYNFIKYSYNGAHTNANSIGIIFTYGFDFWR